MATYTFDLTQLDTLEASNNSLTSQVNQLTTDLTEMQN